MRNFIIFLCMTVLLTLSARAVITFEEQVAGYNDCLKLKQVFADVDCSKFEPKTTIVDVSSYSSNLSSTLDSVQNYAEKAVPLNSCPAPTAGQKMSAAFAAAGNLEDMFEKHAPEAIKEERMRKRDKVRGWFRDKKNSLKAKCGF